MAQQRSPALDQGRSAFRRRALRRAPVVLVLVAVVLAWAGPAAAATRDQFTIIVDYPSSFTCPDGHAVDVTRDGFIQVTLYRNSSGTITESVDKVRFRYTFYSPDTGIGWSSFLNKNNRYDYSAGTDIGAPVTLTSVGSVFQSVPGVGSDAGIQVYVGTIVGYADADDVPFDDVPEVDFSDDPIFSAGSHPDLDFCATTS
jgi:hypothetical protein